MRRLLPLLIVLAPAVAKAGPLSDGTLLGRLAQLEPASPDLTVLTTEPDNTPGWSPDGSRIVFTRKLVDANDPNKFNFDVFTIYPDGTHLKRLTTGGSNDAHAVWTWDNRIVYSTGQNGFRTELSLYDFAFQPDGQNWVMNGDGSNPQPITDTMW